MRRTGFRDSKLVNYNYRCSIAVMEVSTLNCLYSCSSAHRTGGARDAATGSPVPTMRHAHIR